MNLGGCGGFLVDCKWEMAQNSCCYCVWGTGVLSMDEIDFLKYE